ncbi:MAG TPA: HAMP domain-containing sensor histidine kinase [Trebonia sp.]|nr:HAMP domain-containing sensor histidine kinase [Trebonia sp.]
MRPRPAVLRRLLARGKSFCGRPPRLTLLTRFTLVAVGAVAATALAITVVAFLAIRSDLESQVHQQLAQRAERVMQAATRFHGHVPADWVPGHSTQFGANIPYTQVITASGQVWAPPGDVGMLKPDPTALSVAAGGHGDYYQNTKVEGTSAAVLTTSLSPGLALQVAAPLGATETEVATVGAVLTVVSLIGILLATVLGWAVARAGLAPVARLAAVAEQVTATGDPDRRVEVGRHDELGRLAMSFNRMLSALQRSLATQRQLISDASHELRTPLASLRVNVELLADDPGMSEAERKDVLSRVVAQVAELSDLVASVTGLARGERPSLHHGEVRLNDVTAKALEAARRDWPRTRFRVALDGGTVSGDGDRLRTAIRNLLDNAAKFGEPGGLVEVSLHGGELTVRDHGPGIDEDDIPFIFDRFYRALSARAVPGSGLGLSVVSDIAEAHGGAVTAAPASGGGAELHLTLPSAGSPPQPYPSPPAP